MYKFVIAIALAGAAAAQSATWGGDHAQIELTGRGGKTEFDCAHGTIDEPLSAGANGAFSVKGTLTPERGGPVQGEDAPALKATYSGTIKDDAMTLRVTVAGQEAPIGTFELTRGRSGNLRKCR